MARGYVLRAGEIVGAVWLCSRVPPADPERQRPDGRELMPFLDPVPSVDGSTGGGGAVAPAELTAEWTTVSDERAAVTLLERARPL